MLGRFCFSVLILQTYCLMKVSAQGDKIDLRSSSLDAIVPVEFEVGRAAYIPNGLYLSRGEVKLHCIGAKEIKQLIFWSKNGVKQTGAKFHESEHESNVQSIYVVGSEDEARYSCNGLFVDLIKDQVAKAAQNVSVYQNTKVTCIDKVQNEDGFTLQKMDGDYQTTISLSSNSVNQAFWPVKRRKIAADSTFKCNNTERFTFMAEARPKTTVEFKGKTVICTSTDTRGRCTLSIYFGDKVVAQGTSPRVEYSYGKINIKQVKCTADCLIGDINTLPVKDAAEIEINRTLYICVVLAIILIIILLIIIVCCVLWHKFGFKEKYGYQINMRLKKNFAVDTNKLSSYRVSGVQADVPIEVDGSDPDIVKEFRDMDDGSLDDSFVDPNFARTNNKVDMRSKDDISSSGTSNQRPFLRI